jgi:Haem-binding domain
MLKCATGGCSILINCVDLWNGENNLSTRRMVILGVAVMVLGFVALQFVPWFARTNPPVTTQIQWDSPKTQDLMRRACMDCHSNETVWPWYAQIAPISWLIVHDVDEGRSKMNLSTGFRV